MPIYWLYNIGIIDKYKVINKVILKGQRASVLKCDNFPQCIVYFGIPIGLITFQVADPFKRMSLISSRRVNVHILATNKSSKVGYQNNFVAE